MSCHVSDLVLLRESAHEWNGISKAREEGFHSPSLAIGQPLIPLADAGAADAGVGLATTLESSCCRYHSMEYIAKTVGIEAAKLQQLGLWLMSMK